MNSTRLQHFGQRAAAQRAELWPTVVLFRGSRFELACSPVRTRRQLEDAGFEYEHQSIARFPRAALLGAPQVGEKLTLSASGKVMEIAEVIDAPYAAEVVVGLVEP